MIFTLGILDPETTFDSSVGFNFFHAALFISPIPHLSLSPRRSFIAASSFTVLRLPLTTLAAASSRLPCKREKERERMPPSLFSSRRVRVYSRPILSRRRHFAPFIDPAPTHSPAFPATFLSLALPTNRQRAPRGARHTIYPPFIFFISEISPISESPPFIPSDSSKSLPFAN